MASLWESWARFHLLAVRAGGFGTECMGVSSYTLVRQSLGRTSSRRVCRIERLVTVLRASRSVHRDAETWGRKTGETVPPDSRCRPRLRFQEHPALVLQTRSREGAHATGLGFRTTHDSDCLRCASHEVSFAGPKLPHNQAGIFWSRLFHARLSESPRRHRR